MVQKIAPKKKNAYLCNTEIKIITIKKTAATDKRREIMKATEVKEILVVNREMVISYYNEECRHDDSFYSLKWFMTKVMEYANIMWQRRRNIAEKDINTVIKHVVKYHPHCKKGYMSNYQKAVNYYGKELADRIANAR